MRAFAAFLIVASATAGALVVVATAGEPPPRRQSAAPTATPPEPHRVRPRALLDRAPYLGVACDRASSTRCDRVGLAVWVRRDLDSLRGRVGHRAIALDYVGRGGSAAMFVGYLRPAGLRELGIPIHWEGAHAPSIRVRLWASDASRTTTTSTRVPLRAGWG